MHCTKASLCQAIHVLGPMAEFLGFFMVNTGNSLFSTEVSYVLIFKQLYRTGLFHTPSSNEPGHEKPVPFIRGKWRRRWACAAAQSDQRLCCSLPRKYNTYTCLIQIFKTLASLLPGRTSPKIGFLLKRLKSFSVFSSVNESKHTISRNTKYEDLKYTLWHFFAFVFF